MFQELGLDGWTPLAASVVFGLALGALFGALAQRSRFCLRRGLVGPADERNAALATWIVALAAAIGGTTALSVAGYVDFSGHRYHSSNLPVLLIAAGGLMFGAGMVLTRGCASRLTVLAGTGNLRAVTALVFFAVAAYATLKGVFAPIRVWLADFSIDFGAPLTLSAAFGSEIVPAAVLVVILVGAALRLGASLSNLAFGVAIGSLVPLGWVGTGYLLFDEFEPIGLESLAFTSTMGEALFFTVASTAIEPGFGVGLIGGTLAGSFLAALAYGEFKVAGFDRDTPTGNYLAGAVLMGIGGVLAGGCTIGAGLSGISTLSLSAALALVSIIAGAVATNAMRGSLSRSATGADLVPAE